MAAALVLRLRLANAAANPPKLTVAQIKDAVELSSFALELSQALSVTVSVTGVRIGTIMLISPPSPPPSSPASGDDDDDVNADADDDNVGTANNDNDDDSGVVSEDDDDDKRASMVHHSHIPAQRHARTPLWTLPTHQRSLPQTLPRVLPPRCRFCPHL